MPTPDSLPHLKFGIGQPAPRKQDPRLLTGRGRYADDLDLPGQAFMVVLRSPQPHGVLRRIDARPRAPRPRCSRSTRPRTWRRPAMASCSAGCR